MATPRTPQARQKRVQQIADDAAARIAAESDVEEDVVETVEELPPSGAPTNAGAISGLSTLPLAFPFASLFDARRLVEQSFRFAEELLAAVERKRVSVLGPQLNQQTYQLPPAIEQDVRRNRARSRAIPT